MSNNHRCEHGAVSLFVVVFAAMLITVVTVSFIRIMVRDQQQATAIDLSQSAYDSAQAGVEDAKRALIRYQTVCGNPTLATVCATTKLNFTPIPPQEQGCNQVLTDIVADTSNEIKIQQTTGDAVLNLDQAYTCVKLNLYTNNYLGTFNKDDSRIIPLKGVSSFDSINISWFNASELIPNPNPITGITAVDVPDFTTTPLLLNKNWTSSTTPNRPSILRAQLMQFSSAGFVLGDFDGGYNTSTVFLYPSTKAISEIYFNTDRNTPSAPTPVHCEGTLSSGGYACSIKIKLPNPVGGDANSRTAYLNLSSLYKNTSYEIKLLSGDEVVNFDAVQPEVDSTGRANDLFRRVKSRIETAQGTYPDAGISLSGNLCKKFSVTDTETGYTPGDCTP